MQQTHRALIVIDVQHDYIDGNLPIEYPDVRHSLAHIVQLIDVAQAVGVPVVTVQNLADPEAPFLAEGSPGCALHEAIGAHPPEHRIAKRLPSAFAGTDLKAWLQERGITTLTIAGYMTHNCNLATALDAFHQGFDVEFISDASGSVSYRNRAGHASAEEIHRTIAVVLQSRFAAVMEADEWVDMLRLGIPSPERDSIYRSNRRARGLDVQP